MGISVSSVIGELSRIATVVPCTETATDDDGQLWNVCTRHSSDHLRAILCYPSLFGLGTYHVACDYIKIYAVHHDGQNTPVTFTRKRSGILR